MMPLNVTIDARACSDRPATQQLDADTRDISTLPYLPYPHIHTLNRSLASPSSPTPESAMSRMEDSTTRFWAGSSCVLNVVVVTVNEKDGVQGVCNVSLLGGWGG